MKKSQDLDVKTTTQRNHDYLAEYKMIEDVKKDDMQQIKVNFGINKMAIKEKYDRLWKDIKVAYVQEIRGNDDACLVQLKERKAEFEYAKLALKEVHGVGSDEDIAETLKQKRAGSRILGEKLKSTTKHATTKLNQRIATAQTPNRYRLQLTGTPSIPRTPAQALPPTPRAQAAQALLPTPRAHPQVHLASEPILATAEDGPGLRTPIQSPTNASTASLSSAHSPGQAYGRSKSSRGGRVSRLVAKISPLKKKKKKKKQQQQQQKQDGAKSLADASMRDIQEVVCRSLGIEPKMQEAARISGPKMDKIFDFVEQEGGNESPTYIHELYELDSHSLEEWDLKWLWLHSKCSLKFKKHNGSLSIGQKRARFCLMLGFEKGTCTYGDLELKATTARKRNALEKRAAKGDYDKEVEV